MALSTQPYKGARDFYPFDKAKQNFIFDKLKKVCKSFGFLEYDGPLIEPLELYAAKSGSELVNEQLYSFVDRGDRKVAIRPEMTPTLARMIAGKFQEIDKPIRWFSIPNVWRYEKPQKGRLREHWQLNVDILGGDKTLADFEALDLAQCLFKAFGATDKIKIKVNHRGLMDHLFYKTLSLTETLAYEVSKAIDHKAKISSDEFKSWLGKLGLQEGQISKLIAFLDLDFSSVAKQYACEGTQSLNQLFSLFDEKQNKCLEFDASIMRGLDYYTGTVFEAYDTSPENKRALFGGGRYDNLVGLFGKNSISGIGFGLGDVTLSDFLETHKLFPEFSSPIDVFVGLQDLKYFSSSRRISEALRLGGLKVATPLGVDGFGAHLKMAVKKGARFAILFGEEEMSKGLLILKDLKAQSQELLNEKDLVVKLLKA